MAMNLERGIWAVGSIHQAQEHLSTCPQAHVDLSSPLTATKPRSLLKSLLP